MRYTIFIVLMLIGFVGCKKNRDEKENVQTASIRIKGTSANSIVFTDSVYSADIKDTSGIHTIVKSFKINKTYVLYIDSQRRMAYYSPKDTLLATDSTLSKFTHRGYNFHYGFYADENIVITKDSISLYQILMAAYTNYPHSNAIKGYRK